MGLRSSWEMLKETWNEWSEDKAAQQAAAMAFYTLFSLAPLLLIAIAIAGLFFGREAAQGAVMQQARGFVGPSGARTLQEMIANANRPGASIATALVGLLTLLVGAGGVFARLQEMLNTIWDVKPKPDLSLWVRLRQRFISYAMILGVGFLLLVSLVISAALAALGRYLTSLMPGMEALSHVINLLISLVVVTLLFAMIFKVLPDAKVPWRSVWLGALITAALFSIGKFLIGLYLGKSSVGSAYGAAGSVVIILLWVYYSAQILFFGAEFTQVWARRHGQPIEPTPIAQPAR